jgi:predicted nuclease of restriction endonuclease-like RecB superfamily
MLKSEHIRPRLDVRSNEVGTKSLPADYHYLAVAGQLVTLFRRHIGQSRGALADALRDYEGDSLDYPVIRGLAAVLESRCTFDNTPPVNPVAVRAELFRNGPVTRKLDLFHATAREQVIADVAGHYALTPAQVEGAFFADLAEEQILVDTGDPLTPGDLIARYNLEVARGLLYWAREVRLWVYDNYKDLFKFLKLFKLMFTVRQITDSKSQMVNSELRITNYGYSCEQLPNYPTTQPPVGYHITLHGPISPFVTSTIRYGLQFAKFMPALLLCERWSMVADVQPPGIPSREPLRYVLNEQTELRTHFKASGAFDSQLEADFAAEFEEKYGRAERVWELAREDELIVVGDTVMIPDFSFTHRKDGRRALLEIVGFWHPNYLRRKLEKVRQAERKDLILLVYKSANVAEGVFEEASAGEVLMFTRKPVLKDVLDAIERCAILPVSSPTPG